MTPIAVTVRSWELTVLERLHNVVLYQGDLIDNYQVVLVGRINLPDGHPLKTDGFLTAGYTTKFVAKAVLTQADTDAGVINVTLTPIDADNAALVIPPSATTSLDFGSRSQLRYYYQIQISNGSTVVYTIDSGNLYLARDVAVNP
jgi:hypothetical protein